MTGIFLGNKALVFPPQPEATWPHAALPVRPLSNCYSGPQVSSSRPGSQAQISFKPQFLVPPEKYPALEEVGETNASTDPAVLREERLAWGQEANGKGLQ